MFFFLVNLVAGSLRFPPDVATNLADALEFEVPGSVQWLYKWAVSEEYLDKMQALFDGQSPPVSTATLRFAMAASFFILSTNPDMDLVEFATHFRRIIPDERYTSAESIASSYERALSIFHVPDWFYQHVLLSRAAGMDKEAVYATLNTLVRIMRDSGTIRSDDALFNADAQKVRGLAHLWLRFGCPSSAEEPPVYLDINKFEWIMKLPTRKEALRYITQALLIL